MRYAVFSGGKLMRPRLLLAIASSYAPSADSFMLAMRAACAIEYIHAGSLVHDDLPCFDGAPTRRGKPATHVQFGEAMAVLVGDALLSRAVEVLADGPAALAGRAVRILRLLGQATGSSSGLIGGQSLETQYSMADWQVATPAVPAYASGTLGKYHSMKTAALFRLAAEAGAVATGSSESALCAEAGFFLGLAYQLADDLSDYGIQMRSTDRLEPVGTARTVATGTGSPPNTVLVRGEAEVRAQMQTLLKRVRRLGAAIGTDSTPVLELADELEQCVQKILRGEPLESPPFV